MAGKVMSILSQNWATSHYEAMFVVIFLQLSDFPLIKKLKISASAGPIPAEWTLFTFVISGSQWLRCSSCHAVYQPEPAFFFFSTKNCPFELHQPSSCCVLRFTAAVCWVLSEFQVGDSSFWWCFFVVSINILSCVSCIHGNGFFFCFFTGLSCCFECINNSVIQAMYTQWPLLVTPCKIQSEIWALNSAL